MEIIEKIKNMQQIADLHRAEKLTIACVPTMGCLHKGHLSLIKTASLSSDLVVTTLFVNPLQFGPKEDFEQYPRDLESDAKLAKEAGSSYLFVPDASEMYPSGFQTEIVLNNITKKFEGEFRPGHFSGVATVVVKLFNAVKPHIAVFGQKDFQQAALIKQMVADLNLDIDIIVNPTIREGDGLAMSSRNIYLSKEEREVAPSIYLALKNTELLILSGERSRDKINQFLMDNLMKTKNFEVEYASSAYSDSFEEPLEFSNHSEIVLLVAVKLGKTRLIDNLLINLDL